MGDMNGKFVVITGAARVNGIGMATALVLRDRGARVLVTDIIETQDPEDRQPGIDYRKLDVTSEEDWRNIARFLLEVGGLTGLVNNAACYIPKPMAETTLADFERQVQVNQIGTFLGMQHIAPILRENGGGSIVNMSSTAGLRGSVRSFAYSSTKWAVRGMTKAAALDLAPNGIRVNSVHPGPIGTQLLENNSPEQRALRAAQVPLRREGNTVEVAHIVAFLLSDLSSYVTGSEFVVDGGVSL